MDRLIIILIIGLATMVPSTAMLLLTNALFPYLTEKSRSSISISSWRSFLLGVVNMLFLGAILALSIFLVQEVGLPALIFALPGILAIGTFIIGAIIGLGGVSTLVGERLLSDHNPVQQQIRAGIIIFLAFLTPIVGWYAFFPFVVLVGFGGFVSAIFQTIRERRQKEVVESDEA